MKKLKYAFLTLFILVSVSCLCLANSEPTYPSDVPGEEILHARLNKADFPSNSVLHGTTTIRHPKFAGWLRYAQPRMWSDFASGLSDSWEVGQVHYKCQYGFFQNSSEAEFGAKCVIEANIGPESNPVKEQRLISFIGQTIGDSTFSWHSDMEVQNGTFEKDLDGLPYPNEFAGLAIVKGNFTFAIHAGAEKSNGRIDKPFMEAIARKTLDKISISNAFLGISSSLNSNISNQGTLRSLQAKLDVFSKNYKKGKYKVALNDINSFINELDAQRGKHVSESAYQTLKGYADTIVQPLNALMRK